MAAAAYDTDPDVRAQERLQTHQTLFCFSNESVTILNLYFLGPFIFR